MRRSNRRRDPRVELQCHQISSCHLQDPAGQAAGVLGRLLNLSRGGAAVLLEPSSPLQLELGQEILVTAPLPYSGTRLKRTARVIAVRADERGGRIFGLHFVAAEESDRYAQMQEARFADAIGALVQRGGRGRADLSGDFVALLAKQARL